MKILAFTDLHENMAAFSRLKTAIRNEGVGLAVCTGDFTIFGRRTKEMLGKLDTLGVPVVLIHGNHEDEDEVRQVLKGTKNIRWAHQEVLDVGPVRFIGFGGGGFGQEDPDLEAFEQRMAGKFNGSTIFLSHAPPYGTALDQPDAGWHVGSETLRALIARRRPMLVLCGHIHECFHRRDTIAGTLVINPGPDGEILEVDDD